MNFEYIKTTCTNDNLKISILILNANGIVKRFILNNRIGRYHEPNNSFTYFKHQNVRVCLCMQRPFIVFVRNTVTHTLPLRYITCIFELINGIWKLAYLHYRFTYTKWTQMSIIWIQFKLI